MPYGLQILQKDIAQIQHEEAGFGTSRLVATNLIITAAHTLRRSDGSGIVGDGWKFRLVSEQEQAWPFRTGNRVVWLDETLDLALIQVAAHPYRKWVPRMRTCIAEIRGNNVHQVEARGYPRASKLSDRPRDLVSATGRLTAVDANRPLKFGVEHSDLPNAPRADWPGMSGSAVVLTEWPDQNVVWVYGVIQSVPANFDRQLSVSRLAEAWKNANFRQIMVDAGTSEPEDPTFTDEYRFGQLIPKSPTEYKHSVLGMIISSTLEEVPVASLANEPVLHGHSLIDLYRSVETLIERFQDLCDEIVEVLIAGGIQEGVHQSVYGSAPRAGKARLLRANRKLLSIASDMRTISAELQNMLPEGSPARSKYAGILQLCASISVSEDFLVVEFGVPHELGVVDDVNQRFAPVLEGGLGRLAGVDLHDSWDNSLKLPEYARLQNQLDVYKAQLRKAIATAANS